MADGPSEADPKFKGRGRVGISPSWQLPKVAWLPSLTEVQNAMKHIRIAMAAMCLPVLVVTAR